VISDRYFGVVSKADAARFWAIAPADEAGKILPMLAVA
jgi:hypothetical protein